MSRLRLLSLLALASCAAGPAPATVATPSTPVAGGAARGPSRAHAPRPTTGDITAGDLETRLYILADDSLLGREAGQRGNYAATAYIAAEMRRIGLEPGGEGGSYFQSVPASIALVDTTAVIAVHGSPLVYGRDVLPLHPSVLDRVLPQGESVRSVNGAPTVFGGELGGELLDPAAAAGKVVVFTLPRPDGAGTFRSLQTATLAAYHHAAGIAVAALDLASPAILRRFRGPVTHLPPPTAGPSPLALLVTPAAALRLLGVTSAEELRVGTPGHTVSGSYTFTETPVPYAARNVIGILRGRDPTLRDSYVAIGAHNDHIGIERRPLDHDSVLANNMVVRRQGVQDAVRLPTPAEARRIAELRDSLTRVHGGTRPDSVNNGADDDGSGTVAMLEIAERFATAAERPRRSLLFVSHTGEEKGLWGSQWFTDHPTVPRDSIMVQLNMDMVGRGRDTDIMGRGPNNVQLIGPRRLSSQLGALIDSVNASRTPRMDIDPSFDTAGHPLNRYCRSDHFMYARYGIPITYFSLGYHTDYHQVTDEPQYIDYAHMARIASFVHDIAAALADRPHRLVVDGPRQDPRLPCRQ